jgi:hypothetical protein
MNCSSRTYWALNEVIMALRRLFIFVEGSDDVRFFETIIKPRFEHLFDSVELITFACTKSVKVDRFIRGINAMKQSYIIVTDIDFEKSVPAKKSIILSRFSEADFQHIMVIIKEIESWYLAGIDDSGAKALGIHHAPACTDFVTKEHFIGLIPRYYPSKIAFMIEILKHFSLSVAVEKNKSFRFFIDHYVIVNPADAGLPGDTLDTLVGTRPDTDTEFPRDDHGNDTTSHVNEDKMDK